MKLTDKTKKRLTAAGLGAVCVVLVIAIALQFKTEAPNEISTQPSGTVSDEVNPSDIIPSPSAGVNMPPINQTGASASPADTGDSTGTEQSIQAEVVKPTEPTQEEKTDSSKTPDGQKVDMVTPMEHDKVTKPSNPPSGETPKSGDKKDGKIYVPGFGWIDDSGGGVQQNDVGSDGDINKQVGNMD
jgi:hypothetical protein